MPDSTEPHMMPWASGRPANSPATADSPSGVMPAAPGPPENSGVAPRFIEKCWWEPDPTLPANGTGDRLTRSPYRRAARPMMIRISTSASAAATGGCGDNEISN